MKDAQHTGRHPSSAAHVLSSHPSEKMIGCSFTHGHSSHEGSDLTAGPGWGASFQHRLDEASALCHYSRMSRLCFWLLLIAEGIGSITAVRRNLPVVLRENGGEGDAEAFLSLAWRSCLPLRIALNRRACTVQLSQPCSCVSGLLNTWQKAVSALKIVFLLNSVMVVIG